jgi:ATP-dependent Clp protease ATP-binding subunit ClpC
MLLQVMEEGILTDARGRRVDFRNAIIVMTSNIGADAIKRGATLGFNAPKDEQTDEKRAYEDMKKHVTEQLRKAFRPEFLNRVDATVFFRALTREEIKQIVDLELHKVRERLIEHAITLDVTDDARGWLADKGYDPEYGARPLRRLIQNEVEDALSDGILSGKFQLASIVRADAQDGNLVLLAAEEDESELEAPETSS